MATWYGPATSSLKNVLTAGFEALDLLNIGLVITNASGQVLHVNQLAEQILKTRDGLSLTPGGELATVGGNELWVVRLASNNAGASNRGDAGSTDTVLVVPRSSGKRALTLVVRPLKAPSTQYPTGPTAVVFILDPQLSIAAAETDLRQLYGLTSTECRLANLLLEGNSLDECGSLLGIRRSTVRMHLRHLFAKTGVQRQSELISLLFKSLVPVRSGSRRSRNRSAFEPDLFDDVWAPDSLAKLPGSAGDV